MKKTILVSHPLKSQSSSISYHNNTSKGRKNLPELNL